MKTAVVIPAYRPGPVIVDLIRSLEPYCERILLIDDGSGPEYGSLFREAAQSLVVEVLRHTSNRGKGAALKTGIAHALEHFPDIEGIVTADADGQHLPDDILRVRERFLQHPDTMILGSRAFEGSVPVRSRVGNTVTRYSMRLLAGQRLGDTQTGLRAIPREFARSLLALRTSGYDFELDMLMAARQHSVRIMEEPIATVYESRNNSSHFNPFIDSMKVYFVLARFCSSSLLTALIDNVIFWLFYSQGAGLIPSQVAGRSVAVLFNYLTVRRAVFLSRQKHTTALLRYLGLVLLSGTLAYVGIHALVSASLLPVMAAKILVESGLFLVNFAVQRHWVFKQQDDTALSMSPIYRALLWVTLAVTMAVFLRGFSSAGLADVRAWSPAGLDRLAAYLATFTLIGTTFFFAGRNLFGPAIAIAMLGCTAYAVGVIPVAAVILIVSSCAVLGRWLFQSSWALSILAGIALWGLCISIAASLPIHYTAVYVSTLTAVMVLRRGDSIEFFRSGFNLFRRFDIRERTAFLGFSSCALVVVAQWLITLKVEASADALAMHLTIASDMARNHAFTVDFHQHVWALMPMGVDFVYAVAYSLGGEYAARLLNLAMLGCILFLIYRTSRVWLPRGASWLITGLFVCTPITQSVTGSMFVENFIAAMILGSAVAMWSFREHLNPRRLLLTAFLIGSAVGFKLGAIAVAAVMIPSLAVLAARRRNLLGERPRLAVAAATALFLAPALLPYVKAYVLTGNPIYPFANALFATPALDGGMRDARFREPLSWSTLYSLTFHTRRFSEGLNGSFGFQYFLLLPVALLSFFRMKTFVERSALIFGGIAALILLVTQPVARYLYLVFPLLTVAIAAAIARMRFLDVYLYRACVFFLMAAASVNFWFLPAASTYHSAFYTSPIFSERGRKDYLRTEAPVREVVAYLNGRSANGAVAFTQNSDIAELRAPVRANHWHDYHFQQRVRRSRTPEDIFRLISGLRIQHLVTPVPMDSSETKQAPAMAQFVSLCAEPEFQEGAYAALRIKPDCEGRLSQEAQRLAKQKLPIGSYDDADTRLVYRGAWHSSTDFNDSYKHTLTYSSEPGAEVRMMFHGVSVAYGFTKAFNRGMAEILLDGRTQEVLDLYSQSTEWRTEKLLDARSEGTHELIVRVLPKKHKDSQAYFVDLDYLTVR